MKSLAGMRLKGVALPIMLLILVVAILLESKLSIWKASATTARGADLVLSVDQPFFTLVNDIPIKLTVITEPKTPDLLLTTQAFRETMAETSNSFTIIPLDGPELRTDSNGAAHFLLQAGIAGPGLVWLKISAASGGASVMIDGVITSPKRCEDCCKQDPGKFADPSDEGCGSISLFSGERRVENNLLVIPGRKGLDYKLTLNYRSQASNLRRAAKDDFAVDWAMSYMSTFLLPDEDNVISVHDMRTDLFIATGQGGFLSPPEYFEKLSVNAAGDFEVRSQDGTVKTYNRFRISDTSGRLTDTSGRLNLIEDADGNRMSFIYGKPSGLSREVLLEVIEADGRSIRYEYYPQAGATAGVNPGRAGRVSAIRDFSRDNGSEGRVIRFDYDSEGNLASITSPKVQGTFPEGKTFRFGYTNEGNIPGATVGISGIDRERLLHNLVSVEYPNEVAAGSGMNRESLAYNSNAFDPDDFDRVRSYTIGGTKAGVPAGGAINYVYQIVAPRAPTHLLSPNDPFLKNTVTDRRGNITEYIYSAFDTLLKMSEFTRGFRNAEPSAFVTRAEYNSDKLLSRLIMPEGNIIDHVYNDKSPDRFQHGNEIRTVRTPDPDRGGDQRALVTETAYEPVYQHPMIITDPRGLDGEFVPPVSDPAGRARSERYSQRYFFDYQEADPSLILPMLAAELGTTADEAQARLSAAGVELGLGDLNGDGDVSPRIAGNVVRKTEPGVSLLPESRQAAIQGRQLQEITTLYRYNRFGQMTSMVDPEENVHTFTYFPETDPDGDGAVTPPPPGGRVLDAYTGGYLKRENIDTLSGPGRDNFTDPTPTNIGKAYTYDDVGNRTSITDGRGIRTSYSVNELNQVVEITRAAAVPSAGSGQPSEPIALTAFAYLEKIFYDANNNVVRREVEDRGNTSGTGGFVEYTYSYDLLDNLIQKTEEVSAGQTLITRYRYDANQNQTLAVQPEGNAATSQYDERDLLFQSTRGALNATAETLGAPPAPYNPRNGVPSTLTINYDGNRNIIERVDAADTDSSPGNRSLLAGTGDVTTHIYDGFDRNVVIIDAVGNETLLSYDPAGNIIKETHNGPTGGPSPKNNSGGNNVTLSIEERKYDELNRLFQEDKVLFVSSGVTTQRPPELVEGSLTPGDGRVTNRFEYDRKSRRTFITEDSLHTNRTDYDGADRAIKMTDPEGNLVERAFDDNNNVIETRETDVSQVPGVPNEEFLTTNFYDSLNRLQRSVDNIGQTTDYRYDSRNNLAAMADARGPVAGATIARRAFSNGALTVNAINGFGNVTIYFYDGLSRNLRQDQILTASRQGNGTNIGADIFGVKTATPPPDPAQGGGDGRITIRSEWDRNSLLRNQTDDNGNQTQYFYDNLNRRVRETKGTCALPALADRCDPLTSILFDYDPDDNVFRLTDENGSVTACSFDAINRRIACDITRAPGVVGTTAVFEEYDGLSRRTRAGDNNDPADGSDDSIVTNAYDSLSRVIEETQKIGARAARAISSSWFADHHRVGLTYPDGRALEYSFDELDRVKTIADEGSAEAIAAYDYIGARRVAQRRFPINGTRMTYLNDAGSADAGYDGMRRPVRMSHLRADNSLIAGFTHTYDRTNNRLEERKLHDLRNSETYKYDAAYRLLRFDREPDGIQPFQSKWKLDGVGNWRKVNKEKRQHSSFNEIIRRGNNASAIEILSDNNGNVTDDGRFTFQWDYRNRLRKVTPKSNPRSSATYSYDAVGRRIRKVVALSATVSITRATDFYLDGWREIEERNGADVLVQQYVYGIWIDEPLALDADTNSDGITDRRLFYHEDAKRYIAALTDATGAVAERYIYEAYGKPTITDGAGMPRTQSAVGNPYLFTGRRLDPESDLYYYRNRYFDPVLGRFLQRDPIGVWTDAQNLGNGYAYVGNNSINEVDPMGNIASDALSFGMETNADTVVLQGECKATFGASCRCPTGWGCEAGIFTCSCIPPPGPTNGPQKNAPILARPATGSLGGCNSNSHGKGFVYFADSNLSGVSSGFDLPGELNEPGGGCTESYLAHCKEELANCRQRAKEAYIRSIRKGAFYGGLGGALGGPWGITIGVWVGAIAAWDIEGDTYQDALTLCDNQWFTCITACTGP